MTRFFTADHHFGHTNILKYEDALRRNTHGEPFQSVEEMDKYLITQWNATVAPGDTVYHLGDISYKTRTIETVLPILNGNIILIVGNHDPFFKAMHGSHEQQEAARDQALQLGFAGLHIELTLTIPGIGPAKLTHFPYAPPPDVPEYDQRYLHLRPKPTGENALLHGHIHSQWLTKQEPDLPPMINLGVEVWQMRPASEAEIVKNFQGIL